MQRAHRRTPLSTVKNLVLLCPFMPSHAWAQVAAAHQVAIAHEVRAVGLHSYPKAGILPEEKAGPDTAWRKQELLGLQTQREPDFAGQRAVWQDDKAVNNETDAARGSCRQRIAPRETVSPQRHSRCLSSKGAEGVHLQVQVRSRLRKREGIDAKAATKFTRRAMFGARDAKRSLQLGTSHIMLCFLLVLIAFGTQQAAATAGRAAVQTGSSYITCTYSSSTETTTCTDGPDNCESHTRPRGILEILSHLWYTKHMHRCLERARNSPALRPRNPQFFFFYLGGRIFVVILL